MNAADVVATRSGSAESCCVRAATFSGVCHGTLGELLQGPYVSNEQVHISIVSLPVRKYSWAHFTLGEGGDIERDLATKSKCRKAIDIYLAAYGRTLPDGKWTYDTELLQGKGMASSTADIVSTIRCLDAIFGTESSPSLIATILREIERSDSVFLEAHTLYLSARQEVIHRFPGNPRFFVCYIDEGTPVDTESVADLLLSHYERLLPRYLANLERAIAAFNEADLVAIGRCATESATLAQEAIPKRHLDVMLSQQRRYKADGIVVAHTGSLVGYLYVNKPHAMAIGELSAFFRGLGHQCRFVETGF
jgi:uncharacterized protein involved in propanediol utilization